MRAAEVFGLRDMRIIEEAEPTPARLPIDGLAARLARPERFLGLLFFNSMPASQLVVGGSTEPDLVEAAQRWAKRWTRRPLWCATHPDSPRRDSGVAIALEAGVASADDIDKAMTLAYKHPMGPLRTTDIVGLDVRLAIARHLARELGGRLESPAILVDLVAAGHLGRKSTQGVYTC